MRRTLIGYAIIAVVIFATGIVGQAKTFCAEPASLNFGDNPSVTQLEFTIRNCGTSISDFVITLKSSDPYQRFITRFSPGVIKALPPGASSTVVVEITRQGFNPGDYINLLHIYTDSYTECEYGCTYEVRMTVPSTCTWKKIEPEGSSFPAEGGQESVRVTTDSGCPTWSPVPHEDWIHIIVFNASTGVFSYLVDPNTATANRTGTITAAGLTHTVTQDNDTQPPDLELNRGALHCGDSGGTIDFSWAATDNVTPVRKIVYRYRLDSKPWSGWSSTQAKSYSGISNGTHTFAVQARDLASNSSLRTATFPVQCVSSSPGAGTPHLALSRDTLDFGASFTTRTFSIWNDGTGSLNYTISSHTSWIKKIMPSSGSSTGERHTITVIINRSGQSMGHHTGTVTIDSNGGRRVLRVTCEVTSSPSDIPVGISHTSKDIEAVGTALAVIGQAVDSDELTSFGSNLASSAGLVTSGIDISARAEELKKIADQIQGTKSEIEKGRLYGEAIDDYLNLEGDIVKSIGHTASFVGVASLPAQAFTASVSGPTLALAGIAAIAGGSFQRVAYITEHSSAARTAALEQGDLLLARAEEDVMQLGIPYQYISEIKACHTVAYKYSYTSQVWWRKERKEGIAARDYCIYTAASWNRRDEESLDFVVVLWFSNLSWSSRLPPEHTPNNELNLTVTLTWEYNNAPIQKAVVISNLDVITTIGATKPLTVYQGKWSIPWQAKYGKPSKITLSFTAPGAITPAFLKAMHSL